MSNGTQTTASHSIVHDDDHREPAFRRALSGTAPDLTYTPVLDYDGSDSFTFKANDGQLDSNIATVTITVGGPPSGEVTVASINPNTTGAGTTIDVTITGSGFVDGADVTFENGSGPAPTASDVVVASGGLSLTATVTVKSGGPRGNRVWDVRVTNFDASSGVLPDGFTVTP